MRFGLASESGSRLISAKNQEASLRELAALTQRASVNPLVRTTAIKIVRSQKCGENVRPIGRDDACELQAIFDAVKNGNPQVAPLRNGFAYIADPRYADYFASPVDNLRACLKGACGGDCDDSAGLIAALCASVGFKVGLRAWGRDSGGFSHVYPVVAYPKRPPFKNVVGLDATVPESLAGWEPPKANVLTAWLD